MVDSVVAGENGVYTFNYWWQYASYDQHIIFCPVDGLTEWTVSTTACYDTSVACAEDPAGLIAELSTMPEAAAATLADDATCLDIVTEVTASTELDCNSLLPSGQSGSPLQGSSSKARLVSSQVSLSPKSRGCSSGGSIGGLNPSSVSKDAPAKPILLCVRSPLVQ